MVKKMNKVWAFFYKDVIWVPGVDHRMSLAEVCFTVAAVFAIGYVVSQQISGA